MWNFKFCFFFWVLETREMTGENFQNWRKKICREIENPSTIVFKKKIFLKQN